MSEEKKKLEKWERKDWYVLPYNFKPKVYSWNLLRSRAHGYGKILLDDDKITIGKFSLNYIEINRLEREKNYYLIIYDSNGMNYRLRMFAKSSKTNMISRDKLFSVLSEKLERYEEVKISNAIEYIKTLPKLYKEISLDDLASKTNLDRAQLIEIIENMILNEEFNAEIRGNILKLKKEVEIVTSPTGYETSVSSIKEPEKKEGLLVFVSYATRDADLYNIAEFSRKLEGYKEIGEVLYWQEDMHDSIIEYMNDNLRRSDVVLLFCSPNALESVPVKKEWMAAEAIQKPIIPIFIKPEHIPTLLSDRLGIEFDSFDLQKNVQAIYELVLKKKQK
ncbi:MAG: TIR domain-containing protein [Promethearchaeota archaeon]